MVFNPRGAEVADGSVTNVKLAAGAVTGDKIADGTVDRTEQASDVSFAVTGATSKRVERFRFIKDSVNKKNLSKIRIYLLLRTSNVANNAIAEAWLDNDADWDVNDNYTGTGTPNATVQTLSATNVQVFMEVDTTALADGEHVLNFSLKSDTAGQTATSDYREYSMRNV